jgi:hypothetical protein
MLHSCKAGSLVQVQVRAPIRSLSSFGRAPIWHVGGGRIESCREHHAPATQLAGGISLRTRAVRVRISPGAPLHDIRLIARCFLTRVAAGSLPAAWWLLAPVAEMRWRAAVQSSRPCHKKTAAIALLSRAINTRGECRGRVRSWLSSCVASPDLHLHPPWNLYRCRGGHSLCRKERG